MQEGPAKWLTQSQFLLFLHFSNTYNNLKYIISVSFLFSNGNNNNNNNSFGKNNLDKREASDDAHPL